MSVMELNRNVQVLERSRSRMPLDHNLSKFILPTYSSPALLTAMSSGGKYDSISCEKSCFRSLFKIRNEKYGFHNASSRNILLL